MTPPDNPLLESYATFVAETNMHTDPFRICHALTSEAGEVAGVYAKADRRKHQVDPHMILDEVGDVLWGCEAVLQAHGYTIEDALSNNMNKLRTRMAKNGGKVR